MQFFTEAWRSGDDETPGSERLAEYLRHLEAIAEALACARVIVEEVRDVHLHDALLVEAGAVGEALRLELVLPGEGWSWTGFSVRYEGVSDVGGTLEGLRCTASGGSLELLDDEWHLAPGGAGLVYRMAWIAGGERSETAVHCERASVGGLGPVGRPPRAPRFLDG